MKTTVSSRTAMRLQGINLVNDYRNVLDDNTYVSAMAVASNIYQSSEGDKAVDLFHAIFGEESDDIKLRMDTMLTCDKILLDEYIPEFYRMILVGQLREHKMTIEDALKAAQVQRKA